MGIRTYNKDKLKERAPTLVEVAGPSAAEVPQSEDPLRFWTNHDTAPEIVDLRVFRDGEYERPNKGGLWSGPFSGRPALIAQLAPVLREVLAHAAPDTVLQLRVSLRRWWRLFDEIESAATNVDYKQTVRVVVVSDLTEIHRQRAFDAGMRRTEFSNFLRVANVVLKLQRLPQLYWSPPQDPERSRHLPPDWQLKEIRTAIKHKWFAALDRWNRTEELLGGDTPANDEEKRLLENYRRFQSTAQKTGQLLPRLEETAQGMAPSSFYRRGFNVSDMHRGFYPDSTDIKMAFHQCLAATGWNPATLLALDASESFIEPHPKDASRYLMRGHKERSQSEQLHEGLLKSQGAPGVILMTLIQRTAPLRAHLSNELTKLKLTYSAETQALRAAGASTDVLETQHKAIVKLEQGVRSPWLYASSNRGGVEWLDADTFSRVDANSGATFLDKLIEEINEKQQPDRRLSRLKPGDFRDAFAAYAYQISGGMVLYVMKVLGHKRLSSTQAYLDNTILNEQSEKLYRAFSNSMWHEIKVHRRVDPTIIAKWSRDGEVTDEQRQRLSDYRSLLRSRVGVGCKDPQHPPKRIAPTFVADGRRLCNVQRCTLCLEHAVIFPDSILGLTKRLAELRHIQVSMSVQAFLESTFGEELENTELALQHFDAQDVLHQVRAWEQRIERGEHRVPGFEDLRNVTQDAQA